MWDERKGYKHSRGWPSSHVRACVFFCYFSVAESVRNDSVITSFSILCNRERESTRRSPGAPEIEMISGGRTIF